MSALPKLIAAITASGLASEDAEAGFAGVLAKNADKFMLSIAEKMKDAGLGRDDIWRKTGWFEGADGKWRFEFDDSASSWTPSQLPQKEIDYTFYKNGPLGSAHTNAELYRNYPDIADIDAVVYADKNPRGVGGTHRSDGLLGESITQWDGGSNSTTLHEVQHAIQDREGFSPGGSPGSIPSKYLVNENAEKAQEIAEQMRVLRDSQDYERELKLSNDLWNSEFEPRLKGLSDRNSWDAVDGLFSEFEAIKQSRFPTLQKVEELSLAASRLGVNKEIDRVSAYRRLGGEVEARNVQAREHMSPQERRQTPPWATQDTPDEKQIHMESGYATPAMLGATAAVGAGATAAQNDDLSRLITAINTKIGQGFEALDMPLRGYHGLASMLQSLAKGEGLDASLNRGANVARQSLDETAGQIGRDTADRTGNPYAAALVDAITRVGSPF
jgi:hypothetical protein